jgi:hypothetical protein
VKRSLAILALALAAGVGAVPGKTSGGRCSGPLPQGQAGLPAAVVVTTDCGLFRLGTDGSVTYAGKWKSPVPPVARGYWPDTLAWYGVVHGHVLIGRGMKQLWRSQRTYAHGRYLDVGGVVLGRGRVAFSYYRGRQSFVLAARYGCAERLVARGEVPLAFSSGRLVTWQERGKTLLLHSGGTVRFLAHAIDPQVDHESRMVVFRSNGELYAFDGEQIRDLISLRNHGVTGTPTVEPLGRWVAAHDRRRLVVVGYDGRLFASTALPRSRHPADGVSSPVVVNAAGTAVAFSVTSRNRLRETVYLLAAGKSRASQLFGEKLGDGGGCGQGAWLEWRGQWLLYANGAQQAAVLDSSGQAPAIRLTDVIAQLPSKDGEGNFNADWA